MTQLFLTTILFVVVVTGVLSLLYRDIFVSVILLSIFSFLSALLFYTAHAPDVAITEAAVGAGITTFLFIWAVRETKSRLAPETAPKRSSLSTAGDVLLAAAAGTLLFLFLPSIEEGSPITRDYLFSRGYEETGAVNLVSAVYLNYRAFDTFGETIVLLCAVTGSVYFLSKEK